jgi:hypothetical protein
MRLRGSAIALIALAAFTVADAVAAAPPTLISNALAAAPPTLVPGEPGDTFSIQGTDFQCEVTISGPRAMVCLLGAITKPLARSYAIAATDAGVLIFGATGTAKLVAKRLGPTLSGALQTAPAHKPTHYTLTAKQHVAVIGSHIQCASGTNGGHPTFACGLVTASAWRYWATGTYGSLLSDKGAYIVLAGKAGKITAAAFQKEP